MSFSYIIELQHSALKSPTNIEGKIRLDNSGITGIEQSKIITKKEEGEIFFRRFWEGNLVLFHNRFTNVSQGLHNNYTVLHTIFESVKRCETIVFYFSELCNECETCVQYEGLIHVKDIEICYDSCQATIKKIHPNDPYQCIFDNWETPINLYGLPKISTTSKYPNAKIEYFNCKVIGSKVISQADDLFYYESSTGDKIHACGLDGTSEWYIQNAEVAYETDGSFTAFLQLWREVVTLPISVTGLAGWEILSQTADTVTYYRQPVEGGEINLRHGRYLNDAIDYAFKSTLQECSLNANVRSHFFGIGTPGYSMPVNSAYAVALTDSQNVTIHQQSDVKDSTASDPARSILYGITLKQLLNDLKVLHNVFWSVQSVAQTFHIVLEHVSHYFTSIAHNQESVQSITQSIAHALHKNLCVQYDNTSIAQKEYFEYRDRDKASNKGAFIGQPIEYAKGCTEGEVRFSAALFNADVDYYAGNESADKSGFVIVQNDLIANQLVIGSRASSVTSAKLNGGYAFRYLQEKFHRHNRILESGKMNGISTKFETWKHHLKNDDINLKVCCGDDMPNEYSVFDTKISQKSAYTYGILEQMTLEIASRELTLDLRYAFNNEQ